MNKPFVMRRRFIPDEVCDISADELLFRSDELLVTKWFAIKPRPDFYGGISFTFLERGYKLGQFYTAEGKFLYWYCDIIEVSYDKDKDTYTINDLLLDIKIMPNGEVRVLDADELADALDMGLITDKQACEALRTLDHLLCMIYNGNFPPLECKDYEY